MPSHSKVLLTSMTGKLTLSKVVVYQSTLNTTLLFAPQARLAAELVGMLH